MTPVLALYGGADPLIPPEDIQAFEAALTGNGVPHEIHSYPGAPHSFFDRSFDEHADGVRRRLAARAGLPRQGGSRRRGLAQDRYPQARAAATITAARRARSVARSAGSSGNAGDLAPHIDPAQNSKPGRTRSIVSIWSGTGSRIVRQLPV